MKLTRPLLLVLALLLLGTFAPGAAASGALDPGFGDGGKVRTPVAVGTGEWPFVDAATAPDGSTVVASQRKLLRYLPDGTLDPRFGQSGAVILDKVEGLDFEIAGLAVDSSGRIVVFGTAEDPGTTYTALAYNVIYLHPTYVAVLRFDPAGNPDPSFGSNGVARTDLAQPLYLRAGFFPPQPNEKGVEINPVSTLSGTVDRQGRPLLIAARVEVVPTIGHSGYGFEGRLAARLTASGELDRGFGEGGVVTLPGDENRGIALAGDGEAPLTWGPYNGNSRPTGQIRAFTASGAFDPGFGENGLRTLGGAASDVVVEGSGRVLVLANPSRGFCQVTALRPDGTPARGYGRNGHAAFGLRREGVACESLALGRGGGAFVAGTPTFAGKGPRPSQRPAVVFGLKRSGRLDPVFGSRGRVRAGLGPGTRIAMPRALVDAQGRLLVAASATSSTAGPGVALFRYLLGG